MNNDWKRKYSFLNENEKSLLYLLAKSGIECSDIKHMSKERFNVFINKYIKELKKNNRKVDDGKEIEVTDKDIDTLFYIKKNRIGIKKLINKLSFINLIEISSYPNMKKIYSNVNSKFIRTKIVNAMIMVVSLSIIISSASSLSVWNKDNKKLKKVEANVFNSVNIKEEKSNKNSFINQEEYDLYKDIRTMNVDFDELLKMNDETKGWVYLSGTTVNYPFVQSNDNEYYLNHDFNKKLNQKGWVFLDYRNNIEDLNRNNILYAHGLITEKMFGGMRTVFKKTWLNNKDNHIIKITTKNSKQLWKVFSIYKIDPEEYYITTDFYNDNEYKSFIDTIKVRSEYNFNIDVNTNDKILTLSSCYSKGKRMVVHAKLISYEKN